MELYENGDLPLLHRADENVTIDALNSISTMDTIPIPDKYYNYQKTNNYYSDDGGAALLDQINYYSLSTHKPWNRVSFKQ